MHTDIYNLAHTGILMYPHRTPNIRSIWCSLLYVSKSPAETKWA